MDKNDIVSQILFAMQSDQEPNAKQQSVLSLLDKISPSILGQLLQVKQRYLHKAFQFAPASLPLLAPFAVLNIVDDGGQYIKQQSSDLLDTVQSQLPDLTGVPAPQRAICYSIALMSNINFDTNQAHDIFDELQTNCNESILLSLVLAQYNFSSARLGLLTVKQDQIVAQCLDLISSFCPTLNSLARQMSVPLLGRHWQLIKAKIDQYEKFVESQFQQISSFLSCMEIAQLYQNTTNDQYLISLIGRTAQDDFVDIPTLVFAEVIRRIPRTELLKLLNSDIFINKYMESLDLPQQCVQNMYLKVTGVFSREVVEDDRPKVLKLFDQKVIKNYSFVINVSEKTEGKFLNIKFGNDEIVFEKTSANLQVIFCGDKYKLGIIQQEFQLALQMSGKQAVFFIDCKKKLVIKSKLKHDVSEIIMRSIIMDEMFISNQLIPIQSLFYLKHKESQIPIFDASASNLISREVFGSGFTASINDINLEYSIVSQNYKQSEQIDEVEGSLKTVHDNCFTEIISQCYLYNQQFMKEVYRMLAYIGRQNINTTECLLYQPQMYATNAQNIFQFDIKMQNIDATGEYRQESEYKYNDPSFQDLQFVKQMIIDQQISIPKLKSIKFIPFQQYVIQQLNISPEQEYLLYNLDYRNFNTLLSPKFLLKQYFLNISMGLIHKNYFLKQSVFENQLILDLQNFEQNEWHIFILYICFSGQFCTVNVNMIQSLITYFLSIQNAVNTFFVKILEVLSTVLDLIIEKSSSLNQKHRKTQNSLTLPSSLSLDYDGIKSILLSVQIGQDYTQMHEDTIKQSIIQYLRVIENYLVVTETGDFYFLMYNQLQKIVDVYWPDSNLFDQKLKTVQQVKINAFRQLMYGKTLQSSSNCILKLIQLQYYSMLSETQEISANMIKKLLTIGRKDEKYMDKVQLQALDLLFINACGQSKAYIAQYLALIQMAKNQFNISQFQQASQLILLYLYEVLHNDSDLIQLLLIIAPHSQQNNRFIQFIVKILRSRLGDTNLVFNNTDLPETALYKQYDLQSNQQTIFDLCIEIIVQHKYNKVQDLAFLYNFTSSDEKKELIRDLYLSYLNDISQPDQEQILDEIDDFASCLLKIPNKINCFTDYFNALKIEQMNYGQVSKKDVNEKQAAVTLHIASIFINQQKTIAISMIIGMLNAIPESFAMLCFENKLISHAEKLKDAIFSASKGNSEDMIKFFSNKSQVMEFCRQNYIDWQKSHNKTPININDYSDIIQKQHIFYDTVSDIIANNNPSKIVDYLMKSIECKRNQLIISCIKSESKLNEKSIVAFSQIFHSSISSREIRNQQRPFQQIRLNKSQFVTDDTIKSQNQLHNTHTTNISSFIPENCQIIASIQCNRISCNQLQGQLVILVITNKNIICIPNSRYTEKQTGIIDGDEININSQQQCQNITETRNNLIIPNIVKELQFRQILTQFFSISVNPTIDHDESLDELLKSVITIDQKQILNIIPRELNHRQSGFDVITQNGYTLSFDCMDQYSCKQQLSKQRLSLLLTAEFNCGMLFYIFNKQFGLQIDSYQFKPTVINQVQKLDIQLYSIFGSVIVSPKMGATPELQQILMKHLNSAPKLYSHKYIQYWVQYFSDSIELPQQHIVLPEPFDEQSIKYLSLTTLDSLAKIQLDNLKAQALLYYDLYVNDLITSQTFLAFINCLGGRSINDLSQFPIFPVIKNRHLSKPVQAQIESRMSILHQRLEQLKDQLDPNYGPKSTMNFFNQELFLNGTFCSNSASALYYLFRQQPYTSVLIDLQGQKFDAPDRMFHGYRCLYDVIFETNFKEHIQSLLFSLKMSYNLYGFDVGKRQSGKMVGDLDFETDLMQVSPMLSPNKEEVFLKSIKLELSDLPQPVEEQQKQPMEEEQEDQQVDDILEPEQSDMLESKLENPQNALHLLIESNQCLEKATKKSIFNWVQLFFGNFQNSAVHFNQYPVFTYYMRIMDEKNISQEIDKVKYFGCMPRQLFEQRNVYVGQDDLMLSPQMSSNRINSLQDFILDKVKTIGLPFSSISGSEFYEGRIQMQVDEYLQQRLVYGKKTVLRPAVCEKSEHQHISGVFYLRKDQFSIEVLAKLDVLVPVVARCFDDFVVAAQAQSGLILVHTQPRIYILRPKLQQNGGRGVSAWLEEVKTIDVRSAAAQLSSAGLLYLSHGQQLSVYDVLNGVFLTARPGLYYQVKVNADGWVFGASCGKLRVLTAELTEVFSYPLGGAERFAVGRLHYEFIAAVYSGQTVKLLQVPECRGSCGYETSDIRPDGETVAVMSQFEQEPALLNNRFSKLLLRVGDFELKTAKVHKFKSVIKNVELGPYGEVWVQTTDGWATYRKGW